MVRPWTNQISDEYNKEHLTRQLAVMRSVVTNMRKTSGATDYKDKSQVVNSRENVEVVLRELLRSKVFMDSTTDIIYCPGKDNSLLSESKDRYGDGLRILSTGVPISRYFRSARVHWSGKASAFEEGAEGDQEEEQGW